MDELASATKIAEVIARDNGKTRVDALNTEVLPAAMAVDYYARHARGFLKKRHIFPGNTLLLNKLSSIIRVPYGVIGIISPWNYPLLMKIWDASLGNKVKLPTLCVLYYESQPNVKAKKPPSKSTNPKTDKLNPTGH